MKKRLTARRIALLGIMTAAALVAFLIESLFPSFWVPGAKLGLGNIFALLTVVMLGVPEAVLLTVVRTVIGCLIVGNPSAIIYSLTAGVVSVAVTAVTYSYVFPKISLVAVSVLSAVVHNLTQNVVFCLVTDTPEMLSLTPYLTILGAVSGAAVGIVAYLLIKKIPTSVFDKLLKEIRTEETSESEKG